MRMVIGALVLVLFLGILAPGTGMDPVPVPEPAIQVEPSRGDQTMIFEATAYCYTGNRTYTGTWPSRGTVAVDPAVIPLGTRLWIEGYGEGVAEDTGGVIRGHKIDLYMESEDECWAWGRRTVEVRIIEEGSCPGRAGGQGKSRSNRGVIGGEG